MHLYLDHAFPGERQFVEDFTDNAEHGTRFRLVLPLLDTPSIEAAAR